MILTIDAGNTNIVFGIFENDVLIHSFRLSTDIYKTVDETGLSIIGFFKFFNIDYKKIKGVIICSVVPVTVVLKNAIKKYLNFECLVIGENLSLDLKSLYNNQAQAGADRLVNCYAALKKYGSPFIVVDIGTSTTFDAVNAHGEFLGGAIFIGPNNMNLAFNIKGFRLSPEDIKKPISVIGKDTQECMITGVYYGYIGALKEIISNIKFKMDGGVKVIATGGISKKFLQHSEFVDVIDPTLTLEGLKFIYDDYIKKKS